MPAELNQDLARTALHGISFPAYPLILQELEQILQRDNPDARLVAARIARDITLSAALLKAVNAPLFGLERRCSSLPQAVQVVGMRNVTSLCKALMLRQTLERATLAIDMPGFWDNAEAVAALAAHIATLVPRVVREDAFAFGLLREAGIPLLMQRWPEYRQTLQDAAGEARPMTAIEEERHGIHHATVSQLLVRSWGWPESLCQGIQRHHEIHLFLRDQGVSGTVLTLIAINRLAEHLHQRTQCSGQDADWERAGGAILAFLGMNAAEYRELAQEVGELLK